MAEKDVIRTDKAPGPFQGAPYNQAIRVGDLVFVAGQLGISLETGALAGAGVTEQTEQIMANLGAILDAAGSGLDKLVKTTVFLMDLGDFAAMNEVYARACRRSPAGSLDDPDLGPAERRARRDRGDRPRLSADPARDNGRMRAEQVIATHGNTDFDAFGAMLAARLLYPDAVVAVGTLNRNVRDFYRLHAEELGAVAEVSRLELDAIRRLIVVEVTSASRLGDLESVALDPDVEKVLFDHHAEHELPEWVSEETAVLSTDGALTTTLVGILAERELGPTPLEATAFALGIHEDTGSLTYVTTTQRDIDALSWCFRHGARQDLVNELPPRTARADRAPSPAAPARRARADRAARRRRAARMRHLAGVRRRRVEPRAQDRRSHGCPGARPPRRDGRAGVRRREEQNGSDRRGRDRRCARRWGPLAGGLGDLT